jgi:hypothetical protein
VGLMTSLLYLSSLSYCFRSIGVSNFTVEHLQRLLKIAHVKPAVNQVFPLHRRLPRYELVNFMTDKFTPIQSCRTCTSVGLSCYTWYRHRGLWKPRVRIFTTVINSIELKLSLGQSQLSPGGPWTFRYRKLPNVLA